jgi:plasmid stability protein
MAVMTIRGLDDDVRDKLRVRAAEHGRSMEAEARAILTEAVESPAERTLVDALLQMRAALGGLELEIPARTDHTRDPFA